ncbi:MAG: hypothetical protein AAFR67_18380, partial [Chloroflexota bacterium]
TANTTINIDGNLDINGWTSEDPTSILIFNGGGAQNINWTGSPTFNNYQLGSLTVSNGTTLSLPSNADTRINGNLTVAGTGILNANGSLVAFNDFSAGDKTISGGGTINFNDVSFTSNTTNLASGQAINITGDVVFNANFASADNGLVVFNGTTQQISGTTGSAQFGNFAIQTGTTVNSSMTNPFDLQISDLAVIDGTYNADANTTVVLNGGATQEWRVNGAVNLTDVSVTAGTTVNESVADDNTAVSGTILNNGRINKETKPFTA